MRLGAFDEAEVGALLGVPNKAKPVDKYAEHFALFASFAVHDCSYRPLIAKNDR
jgi:hypothetical protein